MDTVTTTVTARVTHLRSPRLVRIAVVSQLSDIPRRALLAGGFSSCNRCQVSDVVAALTSTFLSVMRGAVRADVVDAHSPHRSINLRHARFAQLWY